MHKRDMKYSGETVHEANNSVLQGKLAGSSALWQAVFKSEKSITAVGEICWEVTKVSKQKVIWASHLNQNMQCFLT